MNERDSRNIWNDFLPNDVTVSLRLSVEHLPRINSPENHWQVGDFEADITKF